MSGVLKVGERDMCIWGTGGGGWQADIVNESSLVFPSTNLFNGKYLKQQQCIFTHTPFVNWLTSMKG